MKRIYLVSVMILFLTSFAIADVVWLNDGSIYFGEIESADSSGIKIKTFGDTKNILQSEIIKSEKSLDNMKNLQVDILLKDGSVLKGKIQNYDEEVGVLVNTNLGQSTLPVSSIKEIYNPTIKELYGSRKKEKDDSLKKEKEKTVEKEKGKSSSFYFGLTGGYYIPFMGLSGDFNNNYNFSVFGEYNTSLIRGLAFGGEFSTVLMDYKVDASKFSIYTFQPYMAYKFLQLKNGTSFIRYFTPFISAGFGAAYITKKNLSNKNTELDPASNFKIGFDINITDSFALRVYSGTETILQKNDSFNRVLFNAGIMYSF